MNNKTLNTLEYQKIKEKLQEFTVSNLGKKMIEKLEPSTNLIAVERMLKETSEAKAILNSSSYIPLYGVHDIEESINKVEKGGILQPEELVKTSDFLRGCRKLKKYMKKFNYIAPMLSSFSESITDLKDIEDEINNAIEGSIVSSKASNKLMKIRKKIEIIEGRIENKLQSILGSSKYKEYIQDFFISKRGDRFVIPIKSAYKNMIDGYVIDKSSTGSTCFIEPKAVANLTNELRGLRLEEEAEEYQILATLTGFIELYLKQIRINIEVMAEYDFAFAKGKYSISIGGVEPKVNDNDYIKIIKGRHPLLGSEVVPLDFEIGSYYRTLVITGPNTGGKTVALKTVGLLTLMTQSGLHIPADEGTEIAVFERIFADIGDNQSIEQSLSTFSAHIKNIIEIMNNSTISTLVILDEIGTGTDPTEGACLAAAILDELYRCGTITIATTHYGEIKDYAKQHKGFQNGCMEFEPDTLKPLYRLTIGKAGKSNALWISKRLGMKNSVVELANKYLSNRLTKKTIEEFEIDDYDLKLKRKKKNNVNIKGVNNEYKQEEFRKGDGVILLDLNKRGIVYEPADEHGEITVFVKGEFIKVNRKRVKLSVRKEMLYPDDYDLDVIFVPYKKRKFKKDLKRGAIKNVSEYRQRIEELGGDINE